MTGDRNGTEAHIDEQVRVAEAPVASFIIEEPPAERHVRAVSDLVRLLVGLAIALIGLVFATGAGNTLVGFERDILGLYEAIPWGGGRILNYAFQGFASLQPVIVGIVVLWRRRFRLLGMIVAAPLLAQILLWILNTAVVLRVGPPEFLEAVDRPLWITQAANPSIDSYFVAGLVAVVVVGSPWLSRSWKRAAWVYVALAVVFRIVSGTELPVDLVVSLGAGIAGGAGVLLLFGAPNRRPRGEATGEAMARAGLPLAEIRRASVDARGSTPYFGVGRDGRALFIKVLGRDERSADLLFRVYRFIRLKDIGDRRPFSSVQRMVEHEALVSLYANDEGVPTPRLVAATNVGDDGFLLAYEQIVGNSLDRVPDDALTDDVLRAIWEDVGTMRAHRIAHRDLRLANVFLGDDGRPWMIDFGFAEIAATDQMLATDAAELLSSTALKVGSHRAVDTAIEVLGKDPIARAASRIQPLALSTATRKSLAIHKPLVDDLRQYAAEASGAGDVEPEDLQRIKLRTIVTFAALALAVYFLIPQLADVAGVWATIQDANWAWGLWALAASLLTYVGAAVGVMGAIPDRLSFIRTFEAQLAGSFVNRITPARVGGIATNVRFLQKQGVDLAVASSGIGLQQLAGLLVHIALTFGFLIWAGRAGTEALQLPSSQTMLIVGVVLLALSALAFLLPWGRRILRKRVLPIVVRSLHGVADVARHPLKLGALFGGAAFLTLSYVAAFYLSTQAFGATLGIATIGAVYLGGAALSAAAPTPGGIGAVEAALIAGLIAVGMDREVAVPAVFLFRIATFWLPVIPGWIMFTLLQRRGDL